MNIHLFTDFGAADIYVGQVKLALHESAPGAAIIDLLHEAPSCNVRASAHLLAALAERIPAGSVVMAVVDPGVGGMRQPVVVHADGRRFVGPDNGLLSVIADRARDMRTFAIDWRPERLSASFHGRDLFAPVAGMLARGDLDAGWLAPKTGLDVRFGADDLPEVIYIDHYGNALTGLRADRVERDARMTIVEHRIAHARVFSEVAPGELFWYENSLGLVEIAANSGSAAHRLGLRVGQPVRVGG
jgi:S-adenosylmethionine hydrolase